MEFQTDLIPARLIRRYKRFISEAVLTDGSEVIAHCPNPGAMTGLADTDAKIWLEPNDDPKKKLKYGWRLTEYSGGFACVDTTLANRVVGEALRSRRITGLGEYDAVRSEVAYGQGSRVDFVLEGPRPLYLEVKSVTLSRRDGLAEFPDTRTVRGEKHLRELEAVARSGQRAAMLYLVQRSDCTNVALAADIDPGYAAAARDAQAAGVEMLFIPAAVSLRGVVAVGPVRHFKSAQ